MAGDALGDFRGVDGVCLPGDTGVKPVLSGLLDAFSALSVSKFFNIGLVWSGLGVVSGLVAELLSDDNKPAKVDVLLSADVAAEELKLNLFEDAAPAKENPDEDESIFPELKPNPLFEDCAAANPVFI